MTHNQSYPGKQIKDFPYNNRRVDEFITDQMSRRRGIIAIDYLPKKIADNLEHVRLDITLRPVEQRPDYWKIRIRVNAYARPTGMATLLWNPVTNAFVNENEFVAHEAPSGAILQIITRAKEAFKRMYNLRGLRAHVLLPAYPSSSNRRATDNVLINYQADNTNKAVKEIRRRSAAGVIQRALLISPHNPVGRSRLLREFESMQSNIQTLIQRQRL